MKSVIYFFAVLCTVHVSKQDLPNPTRILEQLVNIQRVRAEFTLNDLTSFEKRTKQNVELKLDNLRSDMLRSINEIVNSALDEARISVTNGKKKGKDVDYCYEYASHKLNAQSENANAELETCMENSKTIVETPLENVEKTIQATNALLTDLDAIIPDCYSSIFIKMQNCVLRKLFVSRSSLKRLESNGRAVKRTATVSYINAISSARNCVTKPVANVRNACTDIIVRTSTCVRNA